MSQDFLVARNDLTQTTMMDLAPPAPGIGEVVIRVERFAVTANNITYGVAGDMIGYWNFFPAPESWGRIPVWGIGTVTHSEHPEVVAGERYYGYFPMSQTLLVKPEKVSLRGFTDASSHRTSLPVVYNQYSCVSQDNGFPSGLDNHAMLYMPLFTTSFVLDDYFAEHQFFGAGTIVLASASSKTAFGLAFQMQARKEVRVVGLTSAANKEFVEMTGLYDQVLTYDEVERLALTPTAYVDMSGNREVLSRVHHHLKEQLVNSCGVGITHWTTRDTQEVGVLPGAKPEMFFAPSQIVKRTEALGPGAYQQQIQVATQRFMAQVDRWVQINEQGFSHVKAVYDIVLNGARPDQGYVVVNDA